jgi:hypothetical protein
MLAFTHEPLARTRVLDEFVAALGVTRQANSTTHHAARALCTYKNHKPVFMCEI